MRSSETRGEAGADGGAGGADAHGRPVDAHRSAGEGLDAEHPFHQLGASGTLQPGDADDLPGAEREGDAVDVGVAAAVEFEPRVPHRRTLDRIREVRLDGAADHAPHELVRGQGRGLVGRDERAVLEDRDAIAQVEDLLQPVRDVDHGDAAGGEPADDRVEQLDLAVAEGGGRLVHRDDPSIERERLDDLDDLLLGDRERTDARAVGSMKETPRSVSRSAVREFMARWSTNPRRRGSRPR